MCNVDIAKRQQKQKQQCLQRTLVCHTWRMRVMSLRKSLSFVFKSKPKKICVQATELYLNSVLIDMHMRRKLVWGKKKQQLFIKAHTMQENSQNRRQLSCIR